LGRDRTLKAPQKESAEGDPQGGENRATQKGGLRKTPGKFLGGNTDAPKEELGTLRPEEEDGLTPRGHRVKKGPEKEKFKKGKAPTLNTC